MYNISYIGTTGDTLRKKTNAIISLVYSVREGVFPIMLYNQLIEEEKFKTMNIETVAKYISLE